MLLGLKAVVRMLIDDVPDGVERAMAEELLHDQDETRRKVESAIGLKEDVEGEIERRYSNDPSLLYPTHSLGCLHCTSKYF